MSSTSKIQTGFWDDGRAPEIYLPTETMVTLAESVWCNYFRSLESIEGLQLSGEGMDIKLQLILILVSFSSWQNGSYPYLTPKLHGRQLCTCSWNSLREPRWTRRTLSSKYWGSVLWLLTAASDPRGAKRLWPLLHLSPLLQGPPHLAEGLAGDLKDQYLFSTLLTSFSSFSPLGSQTLKIRAFKSNCIYEGN